jgi:hypothetical protein
LKGGDTSDAKVQIEQETATKIYQIQMQAYEQELAGFDRFGAEYDEK